METAVAASEDRADKRRGLQCIHTPEGAFTASPFLWKIGKPPSENLDCLSVPGLLCQAWVLLNHLEGFHCVAECCVFHVRGR